MQIYKDRMKVLLFSQTKPSRVIGVYWMYQNCLDRQRVHVCQILNSQDIPPDTIYIPIYR